MSVLSNLKSSLNFAVEMCQKYTSLYKEWQHNSINKLNDYCKQKITTEEYCQFIHSYNRVLLQYEYWLSQKDWLAFRLNEEAKKCRL